MKVKQIIDSLDSRHEAAQEILRALAAGRKVAAADIDGLNSRFVQVAPLLHKVNDGKGITQADIDSLDSFAGERLRSVLASFISSKRVVRKKRRAGRK